jgi:hypothetical protein
MSGLKSGREGALTVEQPTRARRLTACLVAGLALALTALVVANQADAKMEILQFTTDVSTSQAGGHPDVDYTTIWTQRGNTFDPCNCEDARVLDTHFPTGFIGDPHAIAQCSLEQFTLAKCPVDSQVGVLDLQNGFFRTPIFNMIPHPDEPGLVGFPVPASQTAAFVVLHGRTGGDYGLDATSGPIYHLLPFNDVGVHLWGVPADHSHDVNRFSPEQILGVQCEPYPGGCFEPFASGVAPTPYLQNPTTCGVPLAASVDVRYYEGTVAHAESPWPATTGCEKLTFDPSLTAVPTSESSDTASGLDVDLKVPQPQSVSAPSASEIREVTLTLPKGFSLVASGANGKTACTDEDLLFDTENEAQCPEFAKIGTTTIDSSALPAPIQGSAYIGQPLPGNTFRLFVTADGFATHVKLKGTIGLDPQTGQIVSRFVNLPQAPIQEFQLHFFGSERGIFGTPTKCGSYPVEAEFVPWDAALPNQTSHSVFTVSSGPGGSPCPGATRPLHPALQAGTTDNTAAAFSPLTFQLSRSDGDQDLAGLSVTAPPGLLASLKGVPYCPEAAIAAITSPLHTGLEEQAASLCPAASRIGSVTVGAGPGTKPVYVGGNVYLAGPYKGASLSLVVVVPAVSGPYDLGNVAVRAAVGVNPVTTQVTTTSDPLPLILEGVPLRNRLIQVRLDRPDFTLNPTSCNPFSFDSQVTGDEGAIANPSSHFQVANCGTLAYGPKLSLKLTGGVKRRGHPAIHAVLTTGSHEANSERVVVTLPKGELLDNSHIGTICTRVQFVQNACPPESMIGTAQVTSPLLGYQLEGPVYLRSSSHKLPDIVFDLKGQIDIEISGHVDAVNGRLRATFESLPDAPVSTVKVDLAGGSKGLLINSETLCGVTKRASVEMEGQNGTELERKPKLEASCKARVKRHKRHQNRKGA